MERITVFTPAFNRASTLERTYKSLCGQTQKDFIWMIIDDGSTDNTKELVSEWQKNNNGFTIEYYYKKNGGMHTAHNMAYDKIMTELNVCIDSDDAMPEDAIESILLFWDKYGSNDVAGIIALDSTFNGDIIGTEMPIGITQASTSDLYNKYHAKGDKKFIYRTDIIKDTPPYPEFEGEKLVALGYKYAIVAQKYRMLLFNKVVCLVDYQLDGSSHTIIKQYMQSPRGFAFEKAFEMQHSSGRIHLIKSTIHYIAEMRIAGEKGYIRKSPQKMLTIVLFPLGICAEMVIRLLNKKFQ